MKMDGISSSKLPPEAFKPGLGVEKVRTGCTHGSSPVFPPQAMAAERRQPSPLQRKPGKLSHLLFMPAPSRLFSMLPTLLRGSKNPRPSLPASNSDIGWCLLC